jgi:hypothetical protein
MIIIELREFGARKNLNSNHFGVKFECLKKGKKVSELNSWFMLAGTRDFP